MIIVNVTYTVKSEFVSKNQENIDSFLKDFRKLSSDKFRYIVYLRDDGKTFMHLSMYQDEETQQQVLDVASFISFQKQRDESGLEGPHKIEMMELVGSSFDIFTP
ncbi:MAG TPA: hypothetical protein VNO50_17950 [Pyrinomonadaceae bacterium]|nr:hypothetical protein [Pyrinomonadaceae bacterium]